MLTMGLDGQNTMTDAAVDRFEHAGRRARGLDAIEGDGIDGVLLAAGDEVLLEVEQSLRRCG